MNESVEIELCWPPRACMPNSGAHVHARTRERRRQRREAGGAAITAAALPLGPLRVLLVFTPPDKRRRDLDNLIAACKGALDGVFEANGRDDVEVQLLAGCWSGEVRRPGRVLAIFEPWDDCRDRMAP